MPWIFLGVPGLGQPHVLPMKGSRFVLHGAGSHFLVVLPSPCDDVHLRQYPFETSEVVLNCIEGPAPGPPFLLLHGLCDRWQWLLPVVNHVSTYAKVHAFDMRGHGRSSRAQGAYLPADFCRDAEAFLCAHLSEPAIIFGHSAGGLVALWCAAAHPDKVRAVVNGDLFASTQRLAALIKRPESISFYKALQSLAGQPQDQIEASALASHVSKKTLTSWSISTSLLDPSTLTYYASGEGEAYVAGISMDEILAAVVCPCLLVSGDRSLGGVMAEEDVIYASDRLSDVRHVRLKGVGHGIGLSTASPGQLLRAIDGFIESLR